MRIVSRYTFSLISMSLDSHLWRSYIEKSLFSRLPLFKLVAFIRRVGIARVLGTLDLAALIFSVGLFSIMVLFYFSFLWALTSLPMAN